MAGAGMRKFNYRLVARLTGMLLIYLAVGMVVPIGVSLYAADGAQFSLTVSALIVLMVGLLLRNIFGRHAEYDIRERESIWMTVIIWLMVPLCGTLPYLFVGGMGSHLFVDALFESFSGFTTTGSSVIVHPEELPASLLVYRSMTQWIGGLGLLLFVVATLRKLGVAAGSLYSAEFSGTQQRKLHPRLARSVSRMWRIYILVTLAMIVLLLTQGASLVDSIALAFSTVSTGGFVTHSAGVATLGPGVMSVLVVFMVLSGVNVALLYRLFTFHWRRPVPLWRDEELRVYLLIFIVSVVVCSVSFLSEGNDLQHSISYSVFHIASTMSTSGYYLPSLPRWSLLVSVLTFALIVVGASAGSTGGGIKLRRIIILAKYIGNYFTRMMHSEAVFRVKVNGEVVEDGYIHKVFAFVFLYMAFIVAGAFVLTLCGTSIPEAVCMAAANVSNLGPSPLINNLGGSLDYSLLPVMGKLTLIVLMLAGRLEIFALVAVFSPSYWRRN